MTESIYNQLVNKEAKLAVIGLGYVGLPIALEFAKSIDVIGFDINKERIELLKNKIDPSKELDTSHFENRSITFSSKLEDLEQATFYIIAVPTPINNAKQPNLSPVLSASESIGKVLKKGAYIVYESTVYPGCTEEDCVPILEKESGLKMGIDFKVGYSPERINPGDKKHTIQTIIKIVSGCDDTALEEIAKVYQIVVQAGVHRASSIKVAEAAKIIENTQRDVNIALMNELSKIFHLLDINTFEVLEAAETKWNFLPFKPGLVGGHCIGVDPYYLTYKAKKLGYHAEVINSGRAINDSMGAFVAKETVKMMISQGKDMNRAKVLIMGATFKENVSDVRNSKILDLFNELNAFSVEVDLIDPYASSDEINAIYGVQLSQTIANNYDAVIVAVNHLEYTNLQESDFKKYLKDQKGVFIDVKGIYRNKIKNLKYWSL